MTVKSDILIPEMVRLGRFLSLLVFLIVLFISLIACNKEENVKSIFVDILSNRADGDAFEKGRMVWIAADVSPKNKIDIIELVLLIDGIDVFNTVNAPMGYSWNTSDTQIGIHELNIKVETAQGNHFMNRILVRIYAVNENPCPCAETVTDYDGNTYKTIQIGEQCWMKENLKVTHYSDGNPLVDGKDAGNTQYDTITKYYFNYGNDARHADTYGCLYNWMAAVNGEASEIDLNPSQVQGVCPDGWHLPSDSEWKELEMFLGMSEKEAWDREWRGTIEGGMLKEQNTTHWQSPNVSATNESGFSALPAGHRTMNGHYKSLGKKASFWSSTNHIAYNRTQNPAFRLLHHEESRTYRYQGFHGYLTYARSVRCVKDK